MKSKKDILLLFGIVAILGIGWLFSRDSFSRPSIEDVKQSATTTDENGSSVVPPSPSTQEKATSAFALDPLVHTYEDRKLGFSVRYPEEISLSFPDCVSLNDKKGGDNFAMKICNEKSPYWLALNPAAKSLDDYRHNYVMTGTTSTYAVRVQIMENQDIVTATGAKGLRQILRMEYFDVRTGTSTNDEMRDASLPTYVHYVFYTPRKGTLEIIVFSADPILEKAIVNSLSY